MQIKGKFKGVHLLCPPGCLRLMRIGNHRFFVDFEDAYKQTEHIKIGDSVTIEYEDENNFEVKK